VIFFKSILFPLVFAGRKLLVWKCKHTLHMASMHLLFATFA